MMRGFISFLLLVVLLCFAAAGANAVAVVSKTEDERALVAESGANAGTLDAADFLDLTSDDEEFRRQLMAKKKGCKKNPKKCAKAPPPSPPKHKGSRRLLSSGPKKDAGKGKKGNGKGKGKGSGKKGF